VSEGSTKVNQLTRHSVVLDAERSAESSAADIAVGIHDA